MKPEIQLVSAPVDAGKIPLYEDGAFAPMGLIWLGSYLQHKGLSVEIIDGQHTTLSELTSKLSAPIVGINFNIQSAHSLDDVAANAKAKSSIVVVGGQAATPLAHELLTNSNIDYVVKYDGERALELLAEGRDIKTIPNLVYRTNGQIVDNPVQLMDLTRLPPVDWGLRGIDTKNYWGRFQDILKTVRTNHKHQRPLSAFTKKGCPYRQRGEGCSFCSRVDDSLRDKTPGQVYDEFSYLARLGADRIEEFSDSWLHDRKWLRELAKLVEVRGHLGVPVRVYADTRHIQNEEVTNLMRAIGIDGVVLGIESGNEEILRQNGKPNTAEQILRCADLLGRAGIMASPSYVLGLIGETKETVEDTFRIADEINRRVQIEMSYWSVATPYPGSKIYRLLTADPSMKAKHSGYQLNATELERDFIDRFTDLGPKGLEFLSNRIGERLQAEGFAQWDYVPDCVAEKGYQHESE